MNESMGGGMDGGMKEWNEGMQEWMGGWKNGG